MQQAYGASSFRTSIDRFVAVQPDGLFVVEEDDRVVGTGCCIAYPEGGFGWIGLVATAPTHQRRGIATTITEHLSDVLAEHGCASVLDASAAGAPGTIAPAPPAKSASRSSVLSGDEVSATTASPDGWGDAISANVSTGPPSS